MASTPPTTTTPEPAGEGATPEESEERFRSLERDVRHGVQRYRELAELLPAAITEADRAGRFTFVNRYALESLGFTSVTELHGKTIIDFIAPGDRERARANWGRRLAGEALAAAEYQLVRRDGTTFPAEVRSALIERDGAVVGMRSVVVDISDRVRLERQRRRLQTRMLEAQKLESLGVLAGGIAHDFNNLLTVLMGNAELALLELPDGSPGRSYVADIERAAQRAAELTRQMLAYAGKAPITQREVAINGLIRKMNALLELSTEHRARIELHLAPGLPWLRADPHQLSQVLLNLVTNAVEAIEGVSGTVRVQTGAATLSADMAAAVDVVDGTLAPGRYVTLAVTDDGRGMDEETRRRIFEPFFSTKFTGRGLGLAAVLGIVRAHHGAVAIETTPGDGARFTVYLPVPDSARQRDPTASANMKAPVLDVLTGRVLVVDDEPDVARVAEGLLRRLGLDVRVVHSGPRALEVVSDAHEHVDAVLLDATMPGMSGADTLHALRRMRPQLPVVLCSGYADITDTPEFADAALDGFVSKPYELRTVYAALAEVFEP